jgi:hypothetical protein
MVPLGLSDPLTGVRTLSVHRNFNVFEQRPLSREVGSSAAKDKEHAMPEKLDAVSCTEGRGHWDAESKARANVRKSLFSYLPSRKSDGKAGT